MHEYMCGHTEKSLVAIQSMFMWIKISNNFNLHFSAHMLINAQFLSIFSTLIAHIWLSSFNRRYLCGITYSPMEEVKQVGVVVML
jgi:hypothetical protein